MAINVGPGVGAVTVPISLLETHGLRGSDIGVINPHPPP
jgi:hypothetical protein